MPLDRVGLGYEGDMMTVVRRGKSNLLPVSWEVFCTATAKKPDPGFSRHHEQKVSRVAVATLCMDGWFSHID